jgi:hypothetical protein
MEDIKIDKGVPIPSPFYHNPLRMAVEQMNVGDSIEDTYKRLYLIKKQIEHMTTCEFEETEGGKRYRVYEREFFIRKLDATPGGPARMWRVR